MPVSNDPLDLEGWQFVKSVRNPWGVVPLTGGGKSLSSGAQAYMQRLLKQQDGKDPVSRRHHYVPQSYLREWSTDGKRLWALDTVTGALKQLGTTSVCVSENFYRVLGPGGVPHNRVESLFGVVDMELRRVQRLFNSLEDPEILTFDDLLGLGASMATQRMRTPQQRRIQLQYNRWMVAQNSQQFTPFDNDEANPFREAGIHTEFLFRALWEAADVLTTRQIEVWHDPLGRFLTCDHPVLTPFIKNVMPNLMSAPYIIWPISPFRTVALSNNLMGEKAVIREATGKMVGLVRQAIEQGRERMIFASDDQRDRLPQRKIFRRRPQTRLRCSRRTPRGEHIPPPGCCVEWSVGFATSPDVALCNQGLHVDAPAMQSLA